MVRLPAFLVCYHQSKLSFTTSANSHKAVSSKEQDQLSYTLTTRSSSTLFTWQGTGSPLLNAAVGEDQGISSPPLMSLRPAFLPTTGGKGGVTFPLPCYQRPYQLRCGWFSCAHVLMARNRTSSDNRVTFSMLLRLTCSYSGMLQPIATKSRKKGIFPSFMPTNDLLLLLILSVPCIF